MYKTIFYPVKKKRSYFTLLGLFLAVMIASALTPQATRAASVFSIYFMGNNNYGQFGNGTSTSNAQKTPLAVSIGGLNKIVTVYQASFGIADDGRLLGWGYNADCQLGQGLADQNPHPTPAYVLGPGDNDPYLTNVIDVAGGDQFVVALRSDGTVWTWGNNGYGQLGQGTAGGPNRLRPVQVSGLNNVQVVAIYAGMASVYALTADGSVYGWGDGISGMLGTGDYISHSSPVKLTFPAPPGSTSPVKIRTLAAGYTHALAIDTSNNLWGWGINDSGQLGDGTTTNAPGPKLIQANVQLAAAGYAYSVFSTSDGKVWSSGSNAYGKLGIGDLSISSKLTPQLLPGLTGVSKLAGGYESVLALLADGSVYGWGNSYFGQVGDWPTQYEYRIAQPAKIAGLAGVQSITISRQHSFFTSGPLTRYSAEALDFGSQNLNSVSASQVLTVTNAGSVPLTLSAASLSGANPADFSLTPAASLPLTLNGGEKTTFSLTFKPLATGARSASLDLSDGTGSGPHHVLLTGNGVGTPVLSLSASSLDFGNQIIGSVSPAQTLTLTNSGTADLSINQLQLTGDNAQDFTLSYSANLPLTLAPAASTTLNLGFKPITEGVRNASLVISGNMPDSPVSLGLKGNGTGQRSLSLSAISLDWGKTAYDSPASTKTLTLSNTGNLTLTISKIDLTGDIDYYTLKTPSLPLVLGPGQSYGLYITYFAGVPGYDIDQYYIPATPHNATITLTDDAQDNSQNVQLLAVATSETITEIEDPSNVIWDHVALAPTFPTEISAPRYITITNVSFRPVVINALDFHEAIYNKKYAQYFEVIGGPSLPFTLQPGQVLKFSIAFNPQGNYIPEAYANLLIRYDSCHACLTLPHISASTLNPLKFDTTNLDFGDHPVGTITEKQFMVTNIGPKPYETLAQVVAYIDRGDYKPFRLKNADGLFDYANLNLAPGETRTFTIWGVPYSTGKNLTSISFIGGSTLSDLGEINFAITGNSTPSLARSPASLAFGKTVLDYETRSLPLQLTNLTDQPLLLQQSGVDATAFNTTLPGGLFVLNPHESASYSMTFNPSRPGVYTNTLGLGPSKDYKLASVNLTAEAVSPFSLTPSPVTLGNQPLGTVGTRKVKLTNSYSQNITISAYSFDHYNPNFTVDFPKLPLTLNPGDSVQFTVTYKPTNTWGDYTNLLISLPHSSNGVLPLTGQGVQAAVLAVDPIALDFGGQLINTASKSRTITVKSTTDLPLVVGSVSINNPAFNVEMPKLPVTLQKGQGFNLKVTFQPNQAQVYNSQLQINTDFGLSIGTVALSGEGSATTPLEPGPNTLDFGTVTVGETSKARKVSFTNKLNTKSLTVAKITFSYPTKVLTKDYSTSNLSQSLPIVLAPGQKFLVEVSFSPTIANNRDGYMVLLDPDGNEIGRVAVKGTGSY